MEVYVVIIVRCRKLFKLKLGSEHLGKDTGNEHGGDGDGGEAADYHGREHLAHEVSLLFLVLSKSSAGGLGDDGIGGGSRRER